MRTSITLTLTVVLLCGCDNALRERGATSNYDEQEMHAAISRARGEVDVFIAELSNPTGIDHAVKAPITDGGETEHFWLTDVTFKDGSFHGRIGNDPELVHNVKFGQQWTIQKMEISDWMFMRDDKVHGNYTVRPLLKGLPAAEAEEIRARLANP